MTDAPPRPPFLRRLARFGLRAALVLVVLLAVAFFAATTALDRSPILGSPLAAETDRRIDAEAAALRARPAERGPLRVGWASRPITPPLGTPTLGYGVRFGKGIARVADELQAHAVAIAAGDGPPVVFLTADLCLWMRSLSDRIAEGFTDGPGLARDRIYFGATHTHCGPSGFVDGPVVQLLMGKRDEAVCARIVAGAVGAARAALADLEPGSWREAAAPAPELVENRMRRGEPVDDELYVAEFRKTGSGKRFALVNYSAHATAIDHSLVVGSGDYPGALCRALVASGFDGAAFFAAGTGQAGPALDGKAAYAPRTDAAYEVGKRLAERARGLLERAGGPAVEAADLAVFRSEVALPAYRVPGFGRAFRTDLVGWAIGQPAPRAFVHAVRLGRTVFVGHSFEFSSVIARDLKRRARERGGARLVVTSFNGDHNLYVVPDATYDDGVYESGMTMFGPHLGSYLEHVTERVHGIVAGD